MRSNKSFLPAVLLILSLAGAQPARADATTAAAAPAAGSVASSTLLTTLLEELVVLLSELTGQTVTLPAASVATASPAPAAAPITTLPTVVAATPTPAALTVTTTVATVAVPTPSALPAAATTTAANVMAVSVDGVNCKAGSYTNKPCVTITICEPGTTTCQTVNDILLDTGSFGLRIFKSAIGNITLQPETINGRSIASCAAFGGGNTDWGPTSQADLVLGGEKAPSVPIQVIDSNFVGVKQFCPNSDTTPALTGFNGILGVGLFGDDCGPGCAVTVDNGLYYSCSATSCEPSAVPELMQTYNPIAFLPRDNNGLVLQLPAVPAAGEKSLEGQLLLGIGTEANNTPTGATTYLADPNSGDFLTAYGGQQLTAFLDSGSNGYFFPGNTPQCVGAAAGLFCAPSPTPYTATIEDYMGNNPYQASFTIGNASLLLGTGTAPAVPVTPEFGAPASGMFDWGLPFFFGRSVYVGMGESVSTPNTGPYWSF